MSGKFFRIASAGFVVLLQACGAGSDDDPVLPVIDPARPIDGVWATDCYLNSGSTDSLRWRQSTFTFDNGSMSLRFGDYPDARCSSSSSELITGAGDGSYQLGGTITTDNGVDVRELDLNYGDQVNEFIELEIVYRDGNILYLGFDTNDENAVLRPTRIDFDIPYRLQ